MWPIERFLRHRPASPPAAGRPFALVETGSRGIRITAVDRRAAAEGVRAGMPLGDARAGIPALATEAAEPARDRAALLALARWLGRYGPSRNIAVLDATSSLTLHDHGLWVDIAGVEHLFGGENGLLADLCRRLAAMGLTARAGLADTLGAAHALARYGPRAPDAPDAETAPPGGTAGALAPLPVEALSLAPETILLLRRLGLRRIGQLYDLPRPALERRFRDGATTKPRRKEAGHLAGAVLLRLDEVLGRRAEALNPLTEPPVVAVRRAYAEPFISSELVEIEVERLAGELGVLLQAAGLGARHVRLALYRADGSMAGAAAGTGAPCHDASHLTRLMREKLAALDAGFGIDAMAFEALRVEAAPPVQAALAGGASRGDTVTMLIDRLANRLGPERVTCLAPRASHIPERAQMHVGAFSARQEGREVPPARGGPPRPPLLLARPEPIEVLAEVPEGAPLRFTWRRLGVRVVRAEGPERIAPEWWREIGRGRSPPSPEASVATEGGDGAPPGRPRDYYRIEAEGGGGYWVFRHGLYGEEEDGGAPRWFLHGLYG
jgi:protein ImuB